MSDPRCPASRTRSPVDISVFWSIVSTGPSARPVEMKGLRDVDQQDRELVEIYGITQESS